AIGSDQTICQGGNPAVFTSTTSGSGSGTISYKWESSTDGTNWTDLGVATATYDAPALTTTTQFRRTTISTENGVACESVPTAVVTVTVQDTVIAGAIGSDQTICQGGDPAVFTSTTSGSGSGAISYKWESSTDGTNWTDVGIATATYDAPSLTATTQFRRTTISTENGVACESVPTAVVTVTVQDTVIAGAIGSDQTICQGGDPAVFTNTTSGNGSGTLSYRWESNTNLTTPSWNVISGANSATYDAPSLTATTQYRRTTISTENGVACESTPTSVVTVTVEQCADLSLDKTVDNIEPNVGDIVTFSLTISNEGPNTATGVNVGDVLPSGYNSIINISNGGVLSGSTISWSNLTVPLNGLVLTYQATVNAPTGVTDEYKNVAEIMTSDAKDPDSTPGNGDENEDDYDTVEITLIGTDLGITKEVDIEEPEANLDVVFTIRLRNNGPGRATNIEIEEVLPSGYEFKFYTASLGIYDDISGVWSINSLDSNSSAELKITVKVNSNGDYVNTVSIIDLDQYDSDPSNNSATARVIPICLTVFNEFTPDGDGNNDTFVINCIENYPNNTLEIYNRWGNIVYKKVKYDNTWRGVSNGRATFIEGDKLPVGTYFYILNLGDGSKPRTGWLYINRKN
ncbi:T9SS type B sorting domain-containing protein, partial [Tenacibaculum holothuriorum]|uniref:T9SS type B sorting domain-containing protein n=1 Tax=Tenacibaculum holothuriorum TaxID=1635173 RepID=UPI00117DCD87